MGNKWEGGGGGGGGDSWTRTAAVPFTTAKAVQGIEQVVVVGVPKVSTQATFSSLESLARCNSSEMKAKSAVEEV